MTDEPTLRLTSFLHGERVWRRIGERAHARRHGRQIILAVWKSSCVVCGEAFEITTPASVKTAERSHAFCTTTCQSHRMTPSEIAKLRFAKRDRRRAIFAAMKATRLALPVEQRG